MENKDIIPEENIIIDTVDGLDEDIVIIDEILNEIIDVSKSVKLKKTLSYFSSTIIILSFVHDDYDVDKLGNKVLVNKYNILQVYDRDSKESSYHHVNDVKMEKSLLLNLINKGEANGNKKKYL